MLKRIQSVGFLSKMVADVTKAMGSIPLNDPTTPSLSAGLEVPRMGALKYQVQGLSMEPESQNEVRSLNCHVSIGNCINALQPLMRKPLHNWAATPVLEVLPAAGSDMNAYYNRRSLKFFYYNHKGRNFYFGDSVDIITHELGHAVLDAMRPDFWSVQSLEIWSFHERSEERV